MGSPTDTVGVAPEENRRGRLLRSSIVLRVLASVVFIPCFIVITQRGGYHFLALIDIVIFIGMWEFYAMMEAKGIRPYKGIGIVCGLALSWYMFFQGGVYANMFLTLALMAIMSLELARRDTTMAVYHVATTILGVIYVGFLSSHIVLLRELPLQTGNAYATGSSFVFLAFVVTWASDTGAYFVGTLLGRHPLLPRISRNKTREGAVGGVLFAILGALVARYTFAPYMDLWQAVLLGILGSVVGMAGDLVESMLKRDVDVKDASETIPGHGGVLDRFDSLLFTAPLIYYILKFLIL
jgi:phosphatidate cytidylyltransferase